MSESDPGSNSSLDRTSREYLDNALAHVFDAYPLPVTYGVKAEKAPESFDELLAIVDRTRHPACEMSNYIDGIIDIIAACPDPDEITRALPYIPEHQELVFILPE